MLTTAQAIERALQPLELVFDRTGPAVMAGAVAKGSGLGRQTGNFGQSTEAISPLVHQKSLTLLGPKLVTLRKDLLELGSRYLVVRRRVMPAQELDLDPEVEASQRHQKLRELVTRKIQLPVVTKDFAAGLQVGSVEHQFARRVLFVCSREVSSLDTSPDSD